MRVHEKRASVSTVGPGFGVAKAIDRVQADLVDAPHHERRRFHHDLV